MESVWVAELRVSQRTAAKIAGKHAISELEVRDAIVCVEGLQGSMDEHPVYGTRLMVRLTLRGEPALVVMFDAKHPLGDVWNLGSVYFRNEGA